MGNVSHAKAEERAKQHPRITETLQSQGVLGTNRRTKARFMLNADKKKVYPTLYFKGHGKGKETKKMVELRNKWTEIVTEYTKETK